MASRSGMGLEVVRLMCVAPGTECRRDGSRITTITEG